MKSSLSPTNRTDVYGCSVSLAWSTAFFLSPLFPANMLLSSMTAAGLLALNGTFLFRTFMHPQDQVLKKVWFIYIDISNLILILYAIKRYLEQQER